MAPVCERFRYVSRTKATIEATLLTDEGFFQIGGRLATRRRGLLVLTIRPSSTLRLESSLGFRLSWCFLTLNLDFRKKGPDGRMTGQGSQLEPCGGCPVARVSSNCRLVLA